jgi:hypothetical protein
MKSVRYNNNGRTGLSELDDVKKIAQPLLSRVQEDPGTYALYAIGTYLNASNELLRLARLTKKRIQTARRHSQYAQNLVTTCSKNPMCLTESNSRKAFFRRFHGIMIHLQRISEKSWLDIFEKEIHTIVSS